MVDELPTHSFHAFRILPAILEAICKNAKCTGELMGVLKGVE